MDSFHIKPTKQSCNANKQKRTHELSGFCNSSSVPFGGKPSLEVLHSTLDANIFSRDDPGANCTHHSSGVSVVLHLLSSIQPIQQSRRAMKASCPGHPAELALASRLAAAQLNTEEKKQTGWQPNGGKFWLQLVRFSALVNSFAAGDQQQQKSTIYYC